MNKPFLDDLRDFIDSLMSDIDNDIKTPSEVLKDIIGGFILGIIILVLVFISL